MLERSVRLRTEGLEELLDQRMVETGDDESSDGEEDGNAVAGDRELEQLVEERRRLMPY